ncbi:MAG: tetratricopeptide repeat protein, partial [Mesorhizobium sp.]
MARIGKAKEAFADLDKAISLKPTDPGSYFIRALVWKTIDPDKAIADLDKAIALDPANPKYAEERLSLQATRRPPDPAPSPAYEAAEEPAAPRVYEPLQLYPRKEDHSEGVAWELKRGLEQQVQGYVASAIDSFSSAIQLDPYNAEAFYDLSLAEASQGNYAAAANDCRRAVELDPGRAAAYKIGLGIVRVEADRLGKIEKRATDAIIRQ